MLGSVYGWGDHIPFSVVVTDAEDGSTTDPSKPIDCKRVNVQPGLGHDNHVHTLVTQQTCKGEFETLATGHEGDNNLYYVVNARYLDNGGSLYGDAKLDDYELLLTFNQGSTGVGFRRLGSDATQTKRSRNLHVRIDTERDIKGYS